MKDGPGGVSKVKFTREHWDKLLDKLNREPTETEQKLAEGIELVRVAFEVRERLYG